MKRRQSSSKRRLDLARRRTVHQEIRELLLAGARSPGVELTAQEWQAMRCEADAALQARCAMKRKAGL